MSAFHGRRTGLEAKQLSPRLDSALGPWESWFHPRENGHSASPTLVIGLLRSSCRDARKST